MRPIVLHILGVGCQRCNALAKHARQAAESLGVEYELIRVTEIEEIIDFGVMMTPALAIDGEPRIVGKVASVEEIAEVLKES